MSDQLRTDELTKGTWIKARSPFGQPWQQVEKVEEVDKGTVVPIYKIHFRGGSELCLMANGDRVFETESNTPAEILLAQSGMALPPAR